MQLERAYSSKMGPRVGAAAKDKQDPLEPANKKPRKDERDIADKVGCFGLQCVPQTDIPCSLQSISLVALLQCPQLAVPRQLRGRT